MTWADSVKAVLWLMSIGALLFFLFLSAAVRL